MGNEQGAPATKKEVKQRFTKTILTHYETIDDINDAFNKARLESVGFIVGIDFSASNKTNGEKTYGGKCLHDIDEGNPNPYMRVMDILRTILIDLDDDVLIPVYGFGRFRTAKEKHLFNLSPHRTSFQGMASAIEAYKKVVPSLKLRGTTSFVPLIRKAIEIVKETNQYHILVIICDGQVTDVDENRKIIEEASKYALSIICIGVGDGPFDVMKYFDDYMKNSKFDNFNFVDYYKTCEDHVENPYVSFVCAAFNEIPVQYAIIKKLGILKGPPRPVIKLDPSMLQVLDEIGKASRMTQKVSKKPSGK